MTDQYRWTSRKPLNRDEPVEQGDLFEPTEAETQAFGDLMTPVESDSDGSGPEPAGLTDEDIEDDEAVPDPADLTVGEVGDVAETLDQNDLVIFQELEKDGKERSTALEAINAELED